MVLKKQYSAGICSNCVVLYTHGHLFVRLHNIYLLIARKGELSQTLCKEQNGGHYSSYCRTCYKQYGHNVTFPLTTWSTDKLDPCINVPTLVLHAAKAKYLTGQLSVVNFSMCPTIISLHWCIPAINILEYPQHSPKHRQGWHVVWVSGKEGCGTCAYRFWRLE